MLFGEGITLFVLVGFLLFCLLDVITTDAAEVRNLPKIAWVLLVLIFNPIGGVAWLVAGRPPVGGRMAQQSPRPGRRPHPSTGLPAPGRRRGLAPDDDPEFLADLDRSAADHERMLGSWEEDLRKREEELRRRKGKDDDSPS
ncbi:MAG: PLD nuclease N-terminal domain-containing protein [Pseudonocardiales bacterium]